eukprot:CAMPEP_0170527622 /NCGR_PEP_ID=MMETSP0209-20121228/13083_1 /TAXON_ID=665100 ORGANISM="Litonotus pictus, Strain P1" /NCGR_SAMPLE_ID=MMETSP0209 /ASSEMBLY_ACC=CAM_ASM_000301 /LENGTH=226 /DNA_ID=CAMNT_0010818269 /DNA_START=32 /DNA_END=712 /DNA_ORIENTATION=+
MEFSLNAVFDYSEISEKTQRHISQVYSILGSGILLSGITGYIASTGIIPYSLIMLGFIAVFISEIVYLFTRGSKFSREILSPYSYYAATACTGALFGSLFVGLSTSDTQELKSLILSAFVIASSIFASVTVFSFLTVRRTMIYLGAIVSSLVLSIISIFLFRGPYEAIFGLLIAVLYVIIDTQLMIHKVENGVCEPYEDARHLFYDLVKLTIEIMKILGKNSKKKE